MIKVLIVDDSPTIRQYLQELFILDGEFKVVGTAKDGEEAITMVEKTSPDVVTMDINMPKLNGYEATKKIMQTKAVPIVIVSSAYNPDEVQDTFKAMQAGAVAGVKRPHGLGSKNDDSEITNLIQTVKLMSEVKVITRRLDRKKTPNKSSDNLKQINSVQEKKYEIVAIGASTGGPPVIQNILSKMTPNISVPILIVQHITPGFCDGLVEWLNKTTKFQIKLAEHNESAKPGIVYFAPDYKHMGIDAGKKIFLSDDPPEHSIKPSVSFLFRSIANNFKNNAIGVLLTGMGKDGAYELKLINDNDAMTIIQNKETSVVFGMPGEAMKLNAAKYIISPDEIAKKINFLVGK